MNIYDPDSVSPPWHTLESIIEESGLTEREFAAVCDIDYIDLMAILCGVISIKGEFADKLDAGGYGVKEFWEARTKRYEEHICHTSAT